MSREEASRCNARMRVKLLSGFSPSERIHSCNLMPDNRRVQGPEVSQSPAAFLKAAEKREKPDLVCMYVARKEWQCMRMCVLCNICDSWPQLDEKGCRVDGRKADEIRPICKLQTNSCSLSLVTIMSTIFWQI